MEKKKILFATGTNSPSASGRMASMRTRMAGLFNEDIRFTPIIQTSPIGITSPDFSNCIGVAYTTLPVEKIKEEFKKIEAECGDSSDKRRENIVEMDIDILEYDGIRYHKKDWNRGYIIEMLKQARWLGNEIIKEKNYIMKKTLIILLCFVANMVSAQNFDEFFEDNTLRIDYIFSGDASSQKISLDGLNKSSRWYGKRHNLSTVPVDGNGAIIVKDHSTSEIIYKNSFSTLFQEWLATDEARTTTKAFENVFLIPMPKRAVDVTVELRNNRREVVTSMTHTIEPNDILIRKIGENRTEYKTVIQAADTSNCINIAFVAEGYTEKEMPVFINDVNRSVEALFAHEPFKRRKSAFNIIAVESASEDSGTSVPRLGVWKNTALGSHFDTFYRDRYLTTLHLKKLHDVLAGLPYEHIIILVNTDVYGGGGILNSYNLSAAHHAKTLPVVVHEFGHSFAGLADEYAYENEPIPMYPSDIEPWEPNITTLVCFQSKWKDMVDDKTPIPTPETKEFEKKIGAFEGASYCLKKVYRAMPDCRMRTNENPSFCPVCERAINRLISFYVK